jgi:hypothetical protein
MRNATQRCDRSTSAASAANCRVPSPGPTKAGPFPYGFERAATPPTPWALRKLFGRGAPAQKRPERSIDRGAPAQNALRVGCRRRKMPSRGSFRIAPGAKRRREGSSRRKTRSRGFPNRPLEAILGSSKLLVDSTTAAGRQRGGTERVPAQSPVERMMLPGRQRKMPSSEL